MHEIVYGWPGGMRHIQTLVEQTFSEFNIQMCYVILKGLSLESRKRSELQDYFELANYTLGVIFLNGNILPY